MAELIDKNKLLEDIYNNNPQDVMKYIAQYPETKYKCKQGEWIEMEQLNQWLEMQKQNKELKEENDRLLYTIHTLNQDGINLRNEVARTNNAILKKNEEIKNLKKAIKQIKEILEAKVDMFNTMGMSNDAQLTEQTLKQFKMYLPDINID